VNPFLRLCRTLGDAGFFAALLIMVFLVASIIWEVISRYLLGAPTVWVTEVSGYLVSGILFMAIARVYREGGHARMSLLEGRLSIAAQNRLGLVVDGCTLVFAAFAFWATLELALLSYQLNWRSSTTLAVPLYLPQSLMPAGSAIFVLELIAQIHQKLAHFKAPATDEDGPTP